ncbi:MAG: oligosaccharide flippase family protein [Deltaproteobacteria bacterium]|nr:oligosaccharide flippase family protein [Deltaproteobacteria bacterium]
MSVIKNSIFILMARGIQIAASFFVIIAVARYLSVELYGDYAYIIALVSSVMALTYFGIQQVTIREIAMDRANAHIHLGSALRHALQERLPGVRKDALRAFDSYRIQRRHVRGHSRGHIP